MYFGRNVLSTFKEFGSDGTHLGIHMIAQRLFGKTGAAWDTGLGGESRYQIGCGPCEYRYTIRPDVPDSAVIYARGKTWEEALDVLANLMFTTEEQKDDFLKEVKINIKEDVRW